MAEDSAYTRAKQIEAAIAKLLSGIDVSELQPPVRKLVSELKRGATDARLDVRDYELADTRTEQLREADKAKARLTTMRERILGASQHGMIGPVEVAELSANIDILLAALD